MSTQLQMFSNVSVNFSRLMVMTRITKPKSGILHAAMLALVNEKNCAGPTGFMKKNHLALGRR